MVAAKGESARSPPHHGLSPPRPTPLRRARARQAGDYGTRKDGLPELMALGLRAPAAARAGGVAEAGRYLDGTAFPEARRVVVCASWC